MKKLFYVLMVAIGAVSCTAPFSKESYLKKFDNFVSEVSENHKAYSDKDWLKKTEKYEKFAGVWYDKFKDDLTLSERVKVTTYKAKFHYYSKFGRATSAFKDMLNALNVGEIKASVQSLVSNDLDMELKQLYEEARKAGKVAEETIREIFNEFQINIDELMKR